MRTEHRARVLNLALSHLFLFACLNCDLYLFFQMQDDVKESSVRSSLRAHRTRRARTRVQLFLCLNALNSFECLNWKG